jgi:hypothetical protein
MTGQALDSAWKSKLTAVSCLALAVSGFACTGTIGGETPGAGSGTGSGPGPGGSSESVGASGAKSPSDALAADKGRTTLRRLNRLEYNLTVRDLLGTQTTPGDQLPEDQSADGFDTVGEFLAVESKHILALQASATQLVDELYARPATDAWRTKVMPCNLTAGAEATCARQILTAFARRAFRRPATGAEIDRLMALVDKARTGATYDDGLKAALSAVLLSPHFIYREETSVVPGGAEPKALNAFELATRLSYFLWSTMPDDLLAASADSGKLSSDPAELGAQIDRMLKDDKSSTLTTHFVDSWLSIHRLDSVAPDSGVYPAFDEELRTSAATETTTFFSRLVSDNLPLSNLIDADFTYANARLGKQYGINVTGTEFSKVSLAGTPRAGILGQTAFLMGTSQPNRTSLVSRGDWILERILCAATPPPPANLNIGDLKVPTPGTSLRQVLEEHRADPVCNSCHQFIDPMGLGFENFDGIGAYRTMDNGAPVDAKGTYPDGTAFNGAVELAKLIAKDPRYPACVTSKMLTYGTGRPFSSASGLDYAQAIAARAQAAQQSQWGSWVAMVASSEAFRTNRPDAL